MGWVWVYLLGVITLPVGYAVIAASVYLFSKRGQASSGCKFCRELGWRLGSHAYDFYDHRTITTLFLEGWHRYVIGRLPKHRVLWQAWYDSLGERSVLRPAYVKAQQKYGIRKAHS